MPPLPPLPPARPRPALLDGLLDLNWRMVGTWAALLALFLVLLVTVGASGGPRGPARALAWGLLVLVVAFAVQAVWTRWLGRQLRQASERAKAGDEPAAQAIYQRLARISRGRMRQVAWINLGLIHFHRGELEEGLSWFALLERSRGALPKAYGQLAADHLALGLALRGALEPAAAWAEQARRRGVPTGLATSKLHRVAEAVVASRRGDAAEAHRLVEAAWPEVEKAVSGAQLRPLSVVRAFLAARAGASRPEIVAAAVAAGEHPWLGEGWPELAAWLATPGASPVAARPAGHPA